MRIAVIADIHGNTIALDAVLADAATCGVEQFWFAGDLAAIGPEPVAVLERIAELDRAQCIRGNTDRYVVTGDGPPPTLDDVRADPTLIPAYAGIAASFAWTRGYVTACGWFDWLAALPPDLRLTTPDGVRILAVHAAPGTDDGEGVHPGRSTAELNALFAGAGADLAFVGHTHEPMIRRLDTGVVVNTGSVSNPRAGDRRACYCLMEITTTGIVIAHRRVAYDHSEFAESVLRSHHPAADFILSYQHGYHAPRTPHRDHVPPGEGTYRVELP